MVQLVGDMGMDKFDVVLVWKLTRFTRSLSDLCTMYKRMEEHGISLISYSEAFDCATPAGRMMMNILGTVAQWEREVISENVTLAGNARAAKGLRTCSYALGYDVVKGGDMTINEPEAEIVKFIFSEYAKLKNVIEVSEGCKQRGYKGKKGADFGPGQVQIVLTRFLYCGYYSWHRQPIKGNFPAIIPVPLYNRVQRILKSQGRICGRSRHEALVFLPE